MPACTEGRGWGGFLDPAPSEAKLRCVSWPYGQESVRRTAVTDSPLHTLRDPRADAPGDAPGDVLVVDDEPANRSALAEALQAHGYRVACAADGREALLALASLPRPCTVVLDLSMPVMDGPSLVRLLQLQGALQGLRLVVLTSEPHVPEDLPLSAVLHKPLSLPALLQLLGPAPQPAPRASR
nr:MULTISPECIES: response regulator [Myxococcaceae]